MEAFGVWCWRRTRTEKVKNVEIFRRTNKIWIEKKSVDWKPDEEWSLDNHDNGRQKKKENLEGEDLELHY